jgi:hypothetical protein
MPNVGGPVAVEPKYFRAPEDSKGHLQAEVDGDTLAMRVWWDADDAGDPVIFQRLSDYPNAYMYVAIDWTRRSIITTAYGETDKEARRAILDDLNRRGWNFGAER